MGLNVRLAGAGKTGKLNLARDARELAALHARCFEQSWSEDEFADFLVKKPVEGLFVSLQDQPVGMALLQSLVGETEVLTLGIVPQYRGRGLGYGLLHAVVDQAKISGSKRLYLEVSRNNKAALALYRGFGFAQTGQRKNYYADRSDAILCSYHLQ